MSALTITAITAISNVPLANSVGNVQRPGDRHEVWPTANDVLDWGMGSKMPVARLIDPNVVSAYSTSFHITGSCVFPSSYPRIMDCKLVGRWGSLPKSDTFCESETFQINLTASQNPPPETRPINVTNVTIRAPFSDIVCPVSFRLSGDIYWSVVEAMNPLGTELSADDPTRLEICYLRSKAPAGSDLIRTTAMKTGIDMQGKWPISLLRLYLTQPSDFYKEKNFATIFDKWWGEHLIKRLQTLRCAYNTITGKSSFEVCCGGGSFDLEAFTSNVLAIPDPGKAPPPPLINSFDLTALVQLGSGMLLDGDGYEELESRWVCKTPFGHLKPCMPFGIAGPGVPWPPGVNNPFFRGMDPPAAQYPSIANVNITTDTYLVRARSWLEVTFTGDKDGVLDTSHLVPAVLKGQPMPDVGNRDREAFIKAHAEDPGNMGNSTDNGPPGGGCYTNNSFSTKQTGETAPPNPTNTPVARVGVYNMNGINRPRTGPDPSPFVPIPTVMRPTITATIQAGRNPAFPWFGFNDTSLKQENVIPILLTRDNGTQVPDLKPVIPLGGASSTNINVTRAATKVMYKFTSMPIIPTEKEGILSININVFDSFRHAYEAMEFELAKYERDVSALTSRLRIGGTVLLAGHYSVRTPQSILCMRGNLFIEMTIIGTARPDDAALELVTGMMMRLDTYLGNHVVQYSQVRRPSMATVAPVGPTMQQDTIFNVVLRDIDTLATSTRAISSNGRLLLSAGPMDTTFSHRFFVLRLVPANTPEDVRLTLAAAQQDTFHPGWTDYTIRVA